MRASRSKLLFCPLEIDTASYKGLSSRDTLDDIRKHFKITVMIAGIAAAVVTYTTYMYAFNLIPRIFAC